VPDSSPLIELRRCSLRLDDHPVLDEVSFALRRGERWALVGPNGSGKTMLLKLLRGDLWPTPTGAEYRGYALQGERKPVQSPSKERVAYVGPERQDKYVRYDWNLTVEEVVTTGLFDEDIPLTRPTAVQRKKVSRLLRRFALWGLRRRRILSLSYGQRRLTLVARAFATEAPVLLLDEVFNGLDRRAKEKLRRALEQPRERHAWVLTSHRPRELPASVTHLAEIANGTLVSAGKATGRPRLEAKRGQIYFPAPRKNKSVPFSWLVRVRNADIYRDYRPVIRKLDWTLHKSEHWAILGPNGSGKSTLLSLLYGDLHPALGGTIERAGHPPGSRIEEWKRRVGWVSPELQADHSHAGSIEEIVISGRYSSVGLNEAPTVSDRRLARRWLRFFGLEELRDRRPRQVSYGQLRLALIARAMVNEPELLLLDEPCTGLDGDVRAAVLEMVQRLATSGVQIVMAVHDPEDIVPAIGHVLEIRKRGQIYFSAPDRLLAPASAEK
jgi:molybdate transport system ATP-binding protein